MGGMTAIESARPRPRAFRGDARFFLGILLIAASVVGVWFVVSASRQTVPAFVATRTIVSGEAVGDDDLRLVDVSLGQLEAAYLTADALEAGLVATRTVSEGELVPQSALGAAAAAATTTVVLHSAVEVPGSVEAGSVVEVWEAPLIERGSYDVPRILVADATVVSVTRDDSMMGGGAASLEVVIPRADVAAVLGAMADESALSVVPTAGAAR
jgi:SAF domain-containing protein